MPSPPSTAMWKALLADMDYLGEYQREPSLRAKRSNPASLGRDKKAGLLRRFAPRNDGSDYGVSTARPTSLPLCKSTSASLALASGSGVTGIGGIFFDRTRLSSSCVSRRLPT